MQLWQKFNKEDHFPHLYSTTDKCLPFPPVLFLVVTSAFPRCQNPCIHNSDVTIPDQRSICLWSSSQSITTCCSWYPGRFVQRVPSSTTTSIQSYLLSSYGPLLYENASHQWSLITKTRSVASMSNYYYTFAISLSLLKLFQLICWNKYIASSLIKICI